MAERTTLNGREMGLYTEDFGRGQKPGRKSNTGRKLAIGGLVLAIGGGGAYFAAKHFSRPDVYSTHLNEKPPIVEAVREVPRPDVPEKMKESYTSAMEKSAPAVKDELDGKYPSVEFLKKAILDCFNKGAVKGFHMYEVEILDIGPAEKYGDIKVRYKAKSTYKGELIQEELIIAFARKNGNWEVSALLGLANE